MRTLVLILMCLFCFDVLAHPVSFKNSIGVMGDHAPKISHIQLNYSWKHWFATGLHHLSVRPYDKVEKAHFFSTNFLLKRWNGDGLQGNIYAVLGVGQSRLSGNPKDAGLGLIQFDIEDRKYYFLSKYMQTQNNDEIEIKQATIRVGIAPYVGSFEDIHSWIILEWQKSEILRSLKDQDTSLFLRLFYQNVLFEIGHSLDGDVKFNYITHF